MLNLPKFQWKEGEIMSKSMVTLKKIDKTFTTICRWISYLVGVALLAIMVLAFADIIAAKFFKSMVPSATEWITYLNVVAVFPAVAFVQLSRGHTNVDFLSEYLPKIVQKGIKILGHLLGALVSFLIGWYGFVNMAGKYQKHEMSSSSALTKGAFQVWPFCLVMSVCCMLLCLAFLWCIVREVTGLGDILKAEAAEAAAAEKAAAEAAEIAEQEAAAEQIEQDDEVEAEEPVPEDEETAPDAEETAAEEGGASE